MQLYDVVSANKVFSNYFENTFRIFFVKNYFENDF